MQITFVKTYMDQGIRMFPAGSDVSMDDQTARDLIHHGIAIPTITPPVSEKAVVKKGKREKR